jgi:cytochrome P450
MPVCCADRRTMDDLDPFAPELIDDPYATYAWLREHEPVHWNKRLGTWWISKYADVAAVLVADEGISSATRTYDLGLNASVDLGPFGKTNTLPTLDPPEHTRVRALTMPPFRRRPVAELLPRINGIIDEQLSALSADGQADLMPRLAESLPIRVIAEMLGVPPERSRVFKAWSMDLQRAFPGEPGGRQPHCAVRQRARPARRLPGRRPAMPPDAPWPGWAGTESQRIPRDRGPAARGRQ